MKKGQVGMYIGVVVTLVIAIVIFINVAFPQWRLTTTAQQDTDTLTAHILGAGDTTTTLTYTDMEDASVSIAELVEDSNFTVDYDTGIVTVLNATPNGTYTAAYNYYASGYLTNTAQRSLAGVVVLLLIVGLFGGALKMFGVL